MSEATDRIVAAVRDLPYARYLGVEVVFNGDEMTAVLAFQDHLIGNPVLPAIHGGSHARARRCRDLWRELAKEHLISRDSALGMPGRRLPAGAHAVIMDLDRALAAIERQIDLEPGGHATALLNAYFP